MSRFIKKIIKKYFIKRNQWLVYVPQGTISGFDLEKDLRMVVGNDRPVCFDVGANQGQTVELLQRAFPGPQIHAFEPSRKIFQILQKQKFRIPASIYNYALGKEISQREFINYDKSGLNSFFELDHHEENRFRNANVESREMVHLKTVDWFMQQHGINVVDLLKIDTQGFDLDVLLGAKHAFQKGAIRNVLVELLFIRMYEGQSPANDIVALLAQHNIHLVDYYEKTRQNNTLAWCTALFSKR